MFRLRWMVGPVMHLMYCPGVIGSTPAGATTETGTKFSFTGVSAPAQTSASSASSSSGFASYSLIYFFPQFLIGHFSGGVLFICFYSFATVEQRLLQLLQLHLLNYHLKSLGKLLKR